MEAKIIAKHRCQAMKLHAFICVDSDYDNKRTVVAFCGLLFETHCGPPDTDPPQLTTTTPALTLKSASARTAVVPTLRGSLT